jgi:hypothetical protein
MLTLLDHLEKLVTLTGKKGLTEAYFEKADEHLQAVSSALNISKTQAVIFAHFMNLCDDQAINMSQIAESIKPGFNRQVQHLPIWQKPHQGFYNPNISSVLN